MIFQHYDFQSYVAKLVKETLEMVRLNVLLYPPYLLEMFFFVISTCFDPHRTTFLTQILVFETYQRMVSFL